MNSIKEHEIGISLVIHFSDIVSRIIGNKELMGEMESQSQQFIHVMLESLVNIIDCLIVEYPVIPTLSSFNFRHGLIDGIIEFMSKISFVNEPFIIMFNKILILINLMFHNSLLESWQSAFCKVHHKEYHEEAPINY